MSGVGIMMTDTWPKGQRVSWAVLSDEQMSNGYPFSLLNDEQMSNKVGFKHQPVSDGWRIGLNLLKLVGA